jgi:hypothetical protein
MKVSRSDIGWSGGLALVALLTRLPFRSLYLYHWDSVNFALSLEHYDVRLHQPHPPGYILYSALGGLVNRLTLDANRSLVWISVAGGVLGVVALFWLGVLMFDRRTGLAAAALALTSPQLWFHSEIALSYALEFSLVVLVAGLCYLQLSGHSRLWFWLAILLGVAGGVRQNDLVFLLPLWLVSLGPLSWTKRAASVGVLGAVVVAWLWPMMALSGGLAGYLTALGSESSGIASESPLFSLDQLAANGARLALYVGYGILLGAAPLLWGMWRIVRDPVTHWKDRRVWVFALWIAPSALFYFLVHVRQPGHVFTFLPALILLTAAAALKLGERFRARGAGGALAASLAALNAAFFLLAPASLFGSERLPLQTPTRQTLQQRDRLLGERIDYIRAHFDPASTVILAGGYNFRHPDYYLRDYLQTDLSYRLGDKASALPDEARALVLFDEQVMPELSSWAGFQTVALSGGAVIRYIGWEPGWRAQVSRASFELQAP